MFGFTVRHLIGFVPESACPTYLKPAPVPGPIQTPDATLPPADWPRSAELAIIHQWEGGPTLTSTSLPGQERLEFPGRAHLLQDVVPPDPSAGFRVWDLGAGV